MARADADRPYMAKRHAAPSLTQQSILPPSQLRVLNPFPTKYLNFHTFSHRYPSKVRYRLLPHFPPICPRSARELPQKSREAKGRGYHPADPFMATIKENHSIKENPRTRDPARLISAYVTQFTLCHSFPVRHFATDSTLNGTLYGSGA